MLLDYFLRSFRAEARKRGGDLIGRQFSFSGWTRYKVFMRRLCRFFFFSGGVDEGRIGLTGWKNGLRVDFLDEVLNG